MCQEKSEIVEAWRCCYGISRAGTRLPGGDSLRVAVLIAAALAVLLASDALAADGPVGEWLTEKRDARVRIAPCEDRGDRLCGTITWAQRPPDAPEGPLLDRNNGDPALRTRPIVGLPLLAGFAQDGENHWGGGTIYDPR